MKPTLGGRDLDLLAGARHWDPFSVLGPHLAGDKRRKFVSVRAIQPRARSAAVLRDAEGAAPAEKQLVLVVMVPGKGAYHACHAQHCVVGRRDFDGLPRLGQPIRDGVQVLLRGL